MLGGDTFDIVSPTLQNVGGTCPPVSPPPPNDAHAKMVLVYLTLIDSIHFEDVQCQSGASHIYEG